MFQKINKHMKGDHKSVAEEFHLSNENEFDPPSLEKRYWSNSNAQRGAIVRCTMAENYLPAGPRPYETSPIKVEIHSSEGI